MSRSVPCAPSARILFPFDILLLIKYSVSVILNLDKKKGVTKQDVQKAHTKIQKKIHPDVSPETARLSAIVNEAKEVVLKSLN